MKKDEPNYDRWNFKLEILERERGLTCFVLAENNKKMEPNPTFFIIFFSIPLSVSSHLRTQVRFKKKEDKDAQNTHLRSIS